MVLNKEISSVEYRGMYNNFIDEQIGTAIGSYEINPVYEQKFLEYYQSCSTEIRAFLRSFVFNKVREYKSSIDGLEKEVKIQVEEELKVFESLLKELLLIKGVV